MIMMPPRYRSDCAIRMRKIFHNMGDLRKKSMIDIGCANGYFVANFLILGGKKAIGIENAQEQISIAKAHGLEIHSDVSEITDHFDFGLFLDLYFHDPSSDNYLDWMRGHCAVIYISPSGDGERNNMRLAEVLLDKFTDVRLIYKTDYANRMIFRCE